MKFLRRYAQGLPSSQTRGSSSPSRGRTVFAARRLAAGQHLDRLVVVHLDRLIVRSAGLRKKLRLSHECHPPLFGQQWLRIRMLAHILAARVGAPCYASYMCTRSDPCVWVKVRVLELGSPLNASFFPKISAETDANSIPPQMQVFPNSANACSSQMRPL